MGPAGTISSGYDRYRRCASGYDDAYRINYEILGNSEAALHAHIFPRRMTEPDQYRCGPVFAYPKDERESRLFDSVRDDRLLRSIRDYLETEGYSI